MSPCPAARIPATGLLVPTPSDATAPEESVCRRCSKPITPGQETAISASDGRIHYRCGKVGKMHGTAVESSSQPISQVLLNSLRDPSYRPYCMRCTGLVRMRHGPERFWWKCDCGAEHDERENAARALRSLSLPSANGLSSRKLHGITWLLIRNGCVMLERCPKKREVLGVGEWFVPGGKIEGDESDVAALERELAEEWPSVLLRSFIPLPIIEGSPIPPGPRGLFLMRPFVIGITGDVPSVSADGVELRWTPIAEALDSPVPQVRMMVAAAIDLRGPVLQGCPPECTAEGGYPAPCEMYPNEMFAGCAMRAHDALWLVGHTIDAEITAWEFQGLYRREADAVARCEDDTWFVVPVGVDARVPTDRTPWPNARYPLAQL